MEESSVDSYKECVLKCNEPTQLHSFPSEYAIRKLWLYKLGLDKYDEDLQVCERHFSQTARSEVKIPDQNLPENIQRKESYDKLIEKIMSAKIQNKADVLRLISNELSAQNKQPGGNESSNSADEVSQPEFGENESTMFEERSESSGDFDAVAENESQSTMMDEDLEPLSDLIRIEIDDSSSTIAYGGADPIGISSNIHSSMSVKSQVLTSGTRLTEEYIEDLSQTSITSEERRLDDEFASTIIEEDVNESPDATEMQFDVTTEGAPQSKETAAAEVASQDRPSTATVTSQVILPKTNLSALQSSTPHSPQNTIETLINDTSTLLLDYQLFIKGKYLCDVIEIPEYIVVLTVPKAKELRRNIRPRRSDDLFPRKTAKSLLDIPPSVTISRTISDEPDIDSATQEELDYVYYMGEGENPRRDREIQVDLTMCTKDKANQCDVELDINMMPKSHDPTRDRYKHECLVCGEILLNYLAQVKHFAAHGSEVPTLCQYCGAKFPNSQKLIAHENLYHFGIVMEVKALRCPKLHCEKEFYSKTELHNHIDEHLRKPGFRCNKCFRLFKSSLLLFRHQRTAKQCLTRRSLGYKLIQSRMK